MQERYQRNDWSQEEQRRLGTCCACVVGLGGLGGHIAELLARAGVGILVLVDGDRFEASNLNRQRFAAENSIGQGKAETTARLLSTINSEVSVHPVAARLDEVNGPDILNGCQVAVDALDNVPDRKVLQQLCGRLEIPLIHGAVSGWQGQVTTILPGDNTMERLYPGSGYSRCPGGSRSTPFAPVVVAALEAAEAVKLLLGRPAMLHRRLLTIDLLSMESRTYQI